MRTLPPLSALRAFEAIARTGSVTRAGQELFRTHGAVSRQLKLLQEHIGVPLFEKEGTGLRLNEHGHALHAVVRGVFDQLEEGYARVQQQAHRPSLHVACSATFAMRWLVPNMADFYREKPDVRIRLSMTSAREIRTEGADLVIAWDLTSYSETDRARSIHLAPVAFGPVCIPSYIASAEQGMRITHDFTSSAWRYWDEVGGAEGDEATSVRRIGKGGQITFPHTHLCIEAALSGLGVALVERRLVQKELKDGSLQAPWGFMSLPTGLMAVPAVGRVLPHDSAVFLDWLRARLASEEEALDAI